MRKKDAIHCVRLRAGCPNLYQASQVRAVHARASEEALVAEALAVYLKPPRDDKEFESDEA